MPPRQRPRRSARVLRFGLACLLWAMLGWALASGLSAVLTERAERLAASATPSDPMATAAALERAAPLLRLARRLNPVDPAPIAAAARIEERRAAEPTRSARQADAHIEAAAALLSGARRRQPSWPYHAAALFRLGLKGADVDIDRQLEDALTLGRHEPWLQRNLLAVGLRAWPLLSPDQQAAMLDLARAGLRSQPVAVLALARTEDRWPVLEPLWRGEPTLEPLARRLAPR